MYPSYAQTARRTNARPATRAGQRTDHQTMGRRERLQLLRLFACLILFLVVFLGKGVFPERLVQVRDDILSLIGADTDFRAVFSALGDSLAGAEDFVVEVFRGEEEAIQVSGQAAPERTGQFTLESQFYSQLPDREALTEHFFQPGGGHYAAHLFEPVATPELLPAQPGPDPVPEEVAVPAVGVIVLKSDYSGQPLPERYTMDYLSLGGLETVTPVVGRVNSDYGYRDHPINGKYQFHGGLDIGGQQGDPIRAFAAGKVDYVGEDSSYGLYLQLDHGNGIKSFYAHCSSICVSKGQQVELGEKIGAVGSSGAATGPHLHLELKCGGLRVDPSYYVETLDSQ